MPRQCARLHRTGFLFSSRSDVLFLHVCQSKNAIAAIALQERPNVGTLGYHCTELPVPTDWNSCFKPLEPFVTITMNSWFPEIELMISNLGTVGSPFQTTAISRRSLNSTLRSTLGNTFARLRTAV